MFTNAVNLKHAELFAQGKPRYGEEPKASKRRSFRGPISFLVNMSSGHLDTLGMIHELRWIAES